MILLTLISVTLAHVDDDKSSRDAPRNGLELFNASLGRVDELSPQERFKAARWLFDEFNPRQSTSQVSKLTSKEDGIFYRRKTGNERMARRWIPYRNVEEQAGGPTRKQIVGLPSDGLQRPERTHKYASGKKKGLYKSDCPILACEVDEDHKVHEPVSEEDHQAYMESTHGYDWFPYFHDQERYTQLKNRGLQDGQMARMGMKFNWRERNWEEQARQIAKLRAGSCTDDDFETGFAEEDAELYSASFRKTGRRLADKWHLSVLADEERGRSRQACHEAETENEDWEDCCDWEQWATNEYGELFE